MTKVTKAARFHDLAVEARAGVKALDDLYRNRGWLTEAERLERARLQGRAAAFDAAADIAGRGGRLMAAVGAWVAHAALVEGESQIAVFSSEVNALRHAVENGWKVTLVPFGKTLAEAIAEPTSTRKADG